MASLYSELFHFKLQNFHKNFPLPAQQLPDPPYGGPPLPSHWDSPSSCHSRSQHWRMFPIIILQRTITITPTTKSPIIIMVIEVMTSLASAPCLTLTTTTVPTTTMTTSPWCLGWATTPSPRGPAPTTRTVGAA